MTCRTSTSIERSRPSWAGSTSKWSARSIRRSSNGPTFATGKTLGPGETYISAFTATTTDARLDDAEVAPQFFYHVLIENHRVDVLGGIAMRVYEVVFECETGSRLHALGYPVVLPPWPRSFQTGPSPPPTPT